ncbi:MAG TPA: (2Fe-2S)-binding protein [Bacillota bacterium]|nr:(2Fe-2S)-binding protein [Bacillota bacterium]
MRSNRIVDHPILGRQDEQAVVTFTFDGQTYEGLEGDTIASALLANGVRKLRVHEESGRPRGIYCNIGHCFECRLTVNGTPGVRACVTPIQEGMVIESGRVEPRPFDSANNSNKMPRTYAEFAKGGDADA